MPGFEGYGGLRACAAGARAAGLAALLGLLALIIFGAGPAAAEISVSQNIDRVVSLYRDAAHNWESVLAEYAKRLFWILAGIELSYAAIRLVLRGADMAEWAAELVMQILFIGFFFELLTQSSSWANAIVQSFTDAANQAVTKAGGVAVTKPSDIIAIGIDLGGKILDKTSFLSPARSVGLVICALIVVVCLALIGAFLCVTLIESYIVISAGVLFMGFGGSRFTKDYAIKIVSYAVSVGAKLFVLQLIIGLSKQIFTPLMNNFTGNTINETLICISAALIMLVIAKIVPELVQSLMNGVSVSTGAALTRTVQQVAQPVTGAAWGTGRKGQGVMQTLYQGAMLTRMQRREAAAGGKRAKSWLWNAGESGLETVGARLSGRAGRGEFGAEVAAHMKDKRRDLEAKMKAAGSAPQGTVGPGGTP